MSLYRKWRPRSFSDLVGQDAVVRTLGSALRSGRLTHAYLFSGPRGSGKTSAAKIMARCIDCVAGPTPEPDNTCEHCCAILEGTALDVVEIDAASNRGIDEIRALRDAAKFAPSTMRRKVYIVDEAHMLTKEGANAFLKTLEEPPPHVVFILATTAPEALPATILSRCQRYAFRRIPAAAMVARMRLIADAEGIDVDDGALATIAYRADGGLRDALTMLEQAASFASGRLDAAVVEAAFGAGGRAFAERIVDAYAARDAKGAIAAVEAASDAGAEMIGLIRAVVAELRHVVVDRVAPDLLRGDLAEDDAARVRERARVLPQVRALRALRLLSEALAQARAGGDARLELESAMLRLTLQEEDPGLESLAARVRELEDRLAGGVRPADAEAAAPVVAPPPRPVPPPRAAPAPPSVAPPSVEAAAPLAEPPRSTPPTAPSPVASAPSAISTPPAAPEPPAPEPPASASRRAPSRVAKPAAPEPPPRATADASAPPPGAPVEPSAPSPVPTGSSTAASEPPTLQRAQALWPNVRIRAEGESPPLRGPLSRARIASVEGWSVGVEVGDEHNAAILKGRVAIVERALEAVLGGPCRLGVTVASGTAARGAKKGEMPEPADESLGLLDYAAKRLGTMGDESW